ncbi:MAG: hypothetical protein JWQ87_3004 [Candidatus Sulfotelmatobacter sp.]|nr:hypothetical protein [Candidatus Sulfotelmatobacter sp.]
MCRLLCANHSRLALWIVVWLSLTGPSVLQGQSAQTKSQPAVESTLQGIIRDSGGHPVAGVTVCLQAKDAGTLTLRTDSAGAYRFRAVRQGDYTLRAEMVGYRDVSTAAFTLARNESKTIDLILEAAETSEPPSSFAQAPQFFDEPHFTVAGVTDTTNLGGHGSDTIVRNRDAVAKATASLSKEPAEPSALSSSNSATEKLLRDAAENRPADFDANHQLGKVLVAEGKAREALVYLERASQVNPSDYGNTYELALAHADTGDYEQARASLSSLLKTDKPGHDKVEPHHLLGEICEKLNDPLQAVKEYQLAAELNPSEPYLFDWGAELLLHHAAEPAREVFQKGNRLFPRSARMLAGLGASWYAIGYNDQAAKLLCEASDLNPNDLNPYLLMGKMQAADTTSSEAIHERLERFVRLQPENALANYYYAVSLWKRHKLPEDNQNSAQIKSLLEKAVHLDPDLGLGYLQLGILYAEQKDFPHAITAYQRAIAATSGEEEAHYRLAQAYRQTGEALKAQAELKLYEQISKEKAAEIERQRHEVQQFVYKLGEPSLHSRPQ